MNFIFFCLVVMGAPLALAGVALFFLGNDGRSENSPFANLLRAISERKKLSTEKELKMRELELTHQRELEKIQLNYYEHNKD